MDAKKLIPFTVLLLSMSLIFSSCSGGSNTPKTSHTPAVTHTPAAAGTPAATATQAAAGTPAATGTPVTASTPAPTQENDLPAAAQGEKVVDSWEEYEASKLPLISAIPGKKIYLYGIKPGGVVLYVEGKGHYFDWDYLTPRFVLPRMHVSDFDADGRDELAVILYVGSGTGFSVEELHVVEISQDEVLSRDPSHKNYFVPNPEYFADHRYNSEDYLSLLDKLVKLNSYKKAGELLADIRVAGKSHVVSLKGLQETEKGIVINSTPNFGNIVHFDFDAKHKKLTAQFTLGVTSKTFASPFFIGDVHAGVNYKTGRFTLSGLSYKPDEGFPAKP